MLRWFLAVWYIEMLHNKPASCYKCIEILGINRKHNQAQMKEEKISGDSNVEKLKARLKKNWSPGSAWDLRTGCSMETKDEVSISMVQQETTLSDGATVKNIAQSGTLALCFVIERETWKVLPTGCVWVLSGKINSLRLNKTPGNTEFKFTSPHWLRTSKNLHEKSSSIMVPKFWKKQNPCSEGRILKKSRLMRVFC